MTRRHQPNLSALALLRGKESTTTLQGWTEAFGEGNPAVAERYRQALVRFIGPGNPGDAEWTSYIGHLSPNTRKSYAFAIAEFFEWIARKYGRPVAPHAVRRQDTFDYVNFLANRPFTLEREKIADGDHDSRLAIYDAVVSLGGHGVSQDDIAKAITPAVIPDDLSTQKALEWKDRLARELGRMVLHDLLVRSPTLDELRRDNAQTGITRRWVEIGGRGKVDLVDLYRYSKPPARGVKRTTIAARVAALSSFWDVLAEGENTPGGEPLLQHNIWKEAKRRVSKNLSQERKQAAADQRVPPEIIARLLMSAKPSSNLVEMRDRALLLFLAFTGARVSEATQLRREPPTEDAHRWLGWFMPEHDPPSIEVTRKGGKKMRLPYPPLALRALTEFQTLLEHHAAKPYHQWDNPNGKNHLPEKAPEWRWRDLTRPDAPLFPPLYFWGANSTRNYKRLRPNRGVDYGGTPYTQTMSRQGVLAMLKRMGESAGMSDDEIKKLHPHAIRHFAATAMVRGGKDLRETQAILGHSSITTTEGYLEEIKGSVELSGQSAILSYLERFADMEGVASSAPMETPTGEPSAAPPRPRRTIEATGITLPDEEDDDYEVEGPEEGDEPEMPAAPTPVEEAAFLAASEMAYDIAEASPAAVVDPWWDPPTHMLPASPPNPELPINVVETADGTVIRDADDHIIAIEGEEPDKADPGLVTEIRKNVSPGSPDWVYDAMAEGTGMEVIHFTSKAERKGTAGVTIAVETYTPRTKGARPVTREFVQGSRWLRQNYDPWPSWYGIGSSSLLPWISRSRADRHGIASVVDPVTGRHVKVPAFPVLSPEQVFPEADQGGLLDALEGLYEEWVLGDPERGIAPSPTKTFGLVRWYWVFANYTSRLQAFFQAESAKNPMSVRPPKWVPFEHEARLGSNLRAHKTEWLVSWFRENAHTFITSMRAFSTEAAAPVKGEADIHEFMRPYEDAMAAGANVLVTELPPWFAEDDPVRAIHDANPEEFDRFAAWIANVTGQRLTRERKEQRKSGVDFAKSDWETKRERARELLTGYFRLVIARLQIVSVLLGGKTPEYVRDENADLLGMTKAELKDEADMLKESRKAYEESLRALGVNVTRAEDDPRSIEDRVLAIIERSFPSGDAPGQADANMFRGSALFQPDAFRLDLARHTISHTKEFRQQFALRYDGRDSELIMRRAARALWERAKSIGETEGLDTKQYTLMYAAMLSYVSWIVPAPATMEKEMPAAGRGQSKDARKRWIQEHARLVREWAGWREEDDVGQLPDVEAYMLEHGAGRTEAERAVGISMLMRAFNISEDEAARRYDSHDLLSVQNEQIDLWKSDDTMIAQLGSAIGPDGHMTVRMDPVERMKERLRERAERPEAEPVRSITSKGGTVIVRRRRDGAETASVEAPKLTANAKPCIYEYVDREPAPRAWYQITPKRGPIRRYSPNAMAAKMRYIANQTRVLPSPFRMAAAVFTR